MADFTAEDAERAFLEAYNMPTGMPKHEALERAARTHANGASIRS